ncbi:type III-B CRISPR module RAMP protein Cmr1 [Nocardiopsis sp. HNM0947]|uniref:Type III-B CRISPR module RAMP protein Cmr1 n=1 Tax=Nocardiopsis coralli TaxID=2772213 RepID=A0ABR9PE90_9ACTN|nr:type III-B CRISPR module RAMP protein Cmr1 [Nocardiopsis coralli]MBE3002171.1 type III-B CRISPR module RAMP protein Cmr1 [Nocardiopsis coralli]
MWHTLELRVETPVFNSAGTEGVPHLHTPPEIRVPSLRGGMRFWLRAMAAMYVGDDPRRLRKVEDLVFGTTARTESSDERLSSPVRMRIAEGPSSSSSGHRKQPHDTFPQETHQRMWLAYMLGPGLAKKGNLPKGTFIPPGVTYTLRIARNGSNNEDTDRAYQCALGALWLLLAYGGVGARTRRGFGRLSITDRGESLPDGWSSTMDTPSLDFFEGLDHLERSGPAEDCQPALRAICAKVMGCSPEQLSRDVWPDGAITPFPVMGAGHTVAGISSERFTKWHEALSSAGRELRFFRAERNREHTAGRIARKENGTYLPPEIKTQGWTDIIGGEVQGETRMLRAALGLPLVYKGGQEVRVTRGRGDNEQQLRRASPLRMFPVGNDQRGWRLFSFGFRSALLPTDADVKIFGGRADGRKLDVRAEDAHNLTDQWIETLSKGETFVRGTTQDDRDRP